MIPLESSREWALIGKIEAGDLTALSALYELTVDAVYAVAYGLVGSQPRAELIVRRVYTQTWTGTACCDPNQPSVLQWLIGLAVQNTLSPLTPPFAPAAAGRIPS